jgi:Cell Wall Hydrolase
MSYDQFLIALCLFREARGSSLAAMTAIYNVIRNRACDPHKRWRQTISGVILQPKQFSSFNAGSTDAAFPVAPEPGQSASPDWVAWQNCLTVVETPLIADNTDGANSYESCAPGELPSWANPDHLTCTYGPFRFYKL